MRAGLAGYHALTRAVSPLAPWWLQRRAERGKEDAGRLRQRLGRDLPAPPAAPREGGGTVWLHGASVGESRLTLALARTLMDRGANAGWLLTSQTLTSAQRLGQAMEPPSETFCPAPLDLPGASKRFVAHFDPVLCVFVEGEIWPRQLLAARQRASRLALVNARMSQKSADGWARWPDTAERIFGMFDVLLAADPFTAEALSDLSGREVGCPGNLKGALPPLPADASGLAAARAALGGRAVWLAASTHEGEEAFFFRAAGQANVGAALIVAPRHPERAGAVAAQARQAGLAPLLRSDGLRLPEPGEMLIVDRMGELGLWYRLAERIYLGGGHAPGVGGHNPHEALQLGKSVASGPRVHNFESLMNRLAAAGGVVLAPDEDALARYLQTPPGPLPPAVSALLNDADAPMRQTTDALLALLPERMRP